MKSRKESTIAFGIPLASTNRNDAAYPVKNVSEVHRGNVMPGKDGQRSTHGIGSMCRKIPAAGRPPFSKDLFKYDPIPQSKQPRKQMSRKEQRIHAEPERLQYRPGSHSSAVKPASMDSSVVCEILKFIGTGIFLVLKNTAIAICLIITIACYICAGRK